MATYTYDCEGRCCCRCRICQGIGYWSQFTVTITGCGAFDGSWTVVRRLDSWLISEGCGWENTDVAFNTVLFAYVGTFGTPWTLRRNAGIGSFVDFLGTHNCVDESIFTVGVFFIAGTPVPFTGGETCTITPVAGTWRQCGQNFDGTDYESATFSPDFDSDFA